MNFFSVLNILRKRYFVFIFIDILINFLLIINIVNKLYLFDFLSLSSFFIMINYVSGKYRINDISSYKELIIYIFKILICSFEYLILISLYFYYLKNNFLLINSVQLLNFILLLFISSSFIKLFINNFASKLRLKKYWVFIGDDFIYDLLLSEIKYFKLYNYNIIRYQENIDRQLNIDHKNIKGFIVNSNDYLNIKQEKSYLFKSKKIILNTIVWFEKYLYKLPPFLISNSNYLDTLSIKIKKNKFQFKLKRFGDIFVSIILLIITSPLLIFSAILIKIEDGGPVFYKQIRNGFSKKTFEIIKLRTMNVNAEKEGAKWSTLSDNRVTKIGKILRLFRLDELPQLLLVFTGEMSLIGPRPERPEFDSILEKEIKYYDYKVL